LVTAGNPYAASVKSEVIDLEDSSNICQNLEYYPIQVDGAVGGLINQVDPLVCGGWNPTATTNVCYVVNQPGQSLEMLEERVMSASLTLNSSHLWITGGSNSNNEKLRTSEFVSKDLTSPMQLRAIVLLESIHQLHYFVEGKIMAGL
jgi:hypothetical protein